jgi:hypothetical protein
MKKIALAAALIAVPALAHAQSSAQVGAKAEVSAQAKTPGMSADAQAKVDANIAAAHEKQLPEEPIRQRVAEGQAKGASDAQIVAASRSVLLDLQASHDALVSAGRTQPSNDEVSRGASLIARGYTSAQLEAVARRAPADRSLAVAFDALTSLQAQGVPTANAVAQLESKLAARASDADLRGLSANAAAGAQANGALNAGRAVGGVAGALGGSANGSAAAGATGAGSAAGVAGGVTGGVTGAVGGAVGRRP